jgi:hypothetical protein
LYVGPDENAEEEGFVVDNILSISKQYHNLLRLPNGSLQIGNVDYLGCFNEVIKKAYLTYSNVPKLDLNKKRPKFCTQGDGPSSAFSKSVLFEPLSKIKKMLERIESEVIDFERRYPLCESNNYMPTWGFSVAGCGFYDWYLHSYGNNDAVSSI